MPDSDVITLLTVILSGTVRYTQAVAFTSLTFGDDITLALPCSLPHSLSLALSSRQTLTAGDGDSHGASVQKAFDL